MAYKNRKSGIHRLRRINKSHQEVFSSNAAFNLASLLITISTIFLSVLASGTVKNNPILFGIIGFLSVSTAALLVDYVLDYIIEKVWFERLTYLNFGYLLYSITMSFVAFGVLYFTNNTENDISCKVLIPHNLLFGFTSFFLFLKTMSKKDHQVWLLLFCIFAVYSFCSIINPFHPLIFYTKKILFFL